MPFNFSPHPALKLAILKVFHHQTRVCRVIFADPTFRKMLVVQPQQKWWPHPGITCDIIVVMSQPYLDMQTAQVNRSASKTAVSGKLGGSTAWIFRVLRMDLRHFDELCSCTGQIEAKRVSKCD